MISLSVIPDLIGDPVFLPFFPSFVRRGKGR